MGAKSISRPGLDLSVEFRAPGAAVIDAFFDPRALSTWWRTIRSVTTPRLLGAFALEWEPGQVRDDVLGPLGGVFRGTVMQFDPARGFFIADAFWLPPEGDPIGPMAMEVGCGLCVTEQGLPATRIHITLSGFEESPRWRRYYEVASGEWRQALEALKALLER